VWRDMSSSMSDDLRNIFEAHIFPFPIYYESNPCQLRDFIVMCSSKIFSNILEIVLGSEAVWRDMSSSFSNDLRNIFETHSSISYLAVPRIQSMSIARFYRIV